MEVELASLFFIAAAAFISPVLSALIPHRLFPETVFLLIFGMVMGPHVLGIVEVGEPIDLLSELGLGFLFLLAGYEIDVKELAGAGGKHGLRTWIVTFAVALCIMIPVALSRGNVLGGFAAAIILTTTAFGTLVPILKDRGLTDTVVGKKVVEYGIWGELCPVLAMALLLTTRATWVTIVLLVAFLVVAIVAALVSKRIRSASSRLGKFMAKNAETNAQMNVRAVVMLLVGLVALAAIFQLDVVLGAFAAGFILRIALPEGSNSLEHKLNGLCYGFLIPVFFIVSGTKIDPMGIVQEPMLLILFLCALLLIRSVPIFISLALRKDTRSLPAGTRASIALYCTTALPLIVAVASVAVSSGIITQDVASVLIAAGGLTVLIMPLGATVTMRATNLELIGEGAPDQRPGDPSQDRE